MTEPAAGLDAHVRRLEAIVAAMDRGDLELEQALALFEEGVGHLRAAREILRQGELRVARLLDDGRGAVVAEDLEPPAS